MLNSRDNAESRHLTGKKALANLQNLKNDGVNWSKIEINLTKKEKYYDQL